MTAAGNGVTRRGFIVGGLTPLAVMHAAWAVGLPRFDGAGRSLAGRLAAYYPDRESARVIGREYLRAVPSEASADRLIDLLCSSDRQRLGRVDDEMRRRLLQLRQREDFARDRVVIVDGWVLSQTECRLCALAALL